MLILGLCVHANVSNSNAERVAEICSVLDQTDTFVLFSLEPKPSVHPTNTFRGHQPLGKIQMPKNEDRTNLVSALRRTMGSDINPAIFACFFPRHGISATQGTNTVELLICFECSQMHCFSSRATNYLFLEDPERAAVFNQVLKRSGIPVAK